MTKRRNASSDNTEPAVRPGDVVLYTTHPTPTPDIDPDASERALPKPQRPSRTVPAFVVEQFGDTDASDELITRTMLYALDPNGAEFVTAAYSPEPLPGCWSERPSDD